MPRLALAALLLLTLPASGCGGGEVPLTLASSERSGIGEGRGVVGSPSAESIDDMLDDLPRRGENLSAGARRSRAGDAADWMRVAGLMPVHYGQYYLPLPGSDPIRVLTPPSGTPSVPAHVAGYLTGRHPAHQPELVLVGVELVGAPAAAVLRC